MATGQARRQDFKYDDEPASGGNEPSGTPPRLPPAGLDHFIEALETIDASEAVSAPYTAPDALPEGTYVSRGQFSLSWSIPDQTPGDHGLFPFELLITIGAG